MADIFVSCARQDKARVAPLTISRLFDDGSRDTGPERFFTLGANEN
jgi:hypothetical protein